MKIKYKIVLFLSFVIIGVIGRFVPHFWNMTPVGSLAFLVGAKLGFGWAIALPFSIMAFSDPFLGYYSLPIMLSVYSFFILYGISGFILRDNKKIGQNIFAVGLSSFLFFIFTNMAVWYWGTMYTHNFAGLITSYFMALPFFANQIIGDMFFTSALFLCWEASSFAISYIKLRGLKKIAS
jgi:hypothetical protein